MLRDDSHSPKRKRSTDTWCTSSDPETNPHRRTRFKSRSGGPHVGKATSNHRLSALSTKQQREVHSGAPQGEYYSENSFRVPSTGAESGTSSNELAEQPRHSFAGSSWGSLRCPIPGDMAPSPKGTGSKALSEEDCGSVEDANCSEGIN